jgi:hypothetical protein
MEQADIHKAPPGKTEAINTPNIFIIWLDEHIGKSEEYIIWKSSFFMTMDPTTNLYERKLNKDVIDESIRNEVCLYVQLDQVEFMFQAFVDIEKCFLAIEKNRTKRIILITSGSKGRIIIPALVVNFRDTFVPGYLIYIFCAKMNMITTEGAGDPTNEWAFDYLDHVSMHNHQDDLLTRLVLDIATYFSEEGERLEKSGELDDALKHYQWSKRMWERYDTMEKTRNPMKGKINEMAERINNIEQQFRSKRNNMEVDDISQPCD